MSQIIRLAKATGAQLQQAARHAMLIDTPNMPYGFGNAYYASVPSPMQEQVLRKGLQSVGINYLKVEECVTAASEADHFPPEMQVGLRNLVKAAKEAFCGPVLVEVRVAGKMLYAVMSPEPAASERHKVDPKAPAKFLVSGKGFSSVRPGVWSKVVRFKRKSFVAVVEATDTGLMLSVFKGA